MLVRSTARVLKRSATSVATSSNVFRYRARSLVATGLLGYFLGVASVGLAGYGVYYASNLKQVVDTLSPTLGLLKEVRNALTGDSPAPNIALQYLRQAARAYLAHIPGSGIVVDLTFNHLDAIVDHHGEEAIEHLRQAYSDFIGIVHHGQNKHESHTALEVLALCKRLAEDLGALGNRTFNKKTLGDIIEKATEAKGSVNQVAENVASKVKDAKRKKALLRRPDSQEDASTPNKEE